MDGRESGSLDRLLRGRLVGRDAEMTRLRMAITDAEAQSSRFVAIGGEAGIGKTLLATEVAAVARDAGWWVCTVQCHGGPSLPACWPWAQIAEAIGDRFDREQVYAALGDFAPALARLRPELADVPRDTIVDPDPGSFAVSMSVVRLIQFAAREVPMVLVIEDLHDADESSQQLFAFLAAHLGESRALVIATYRFGVEGRTGSGSPWRKHPSTVDRIDLSPLSGEDVRAFLAWVSGQNVPRRFAEMLHELSGGNPLFLRELLLHLLSAGVLFHDGRRWTSRLSLDQMTFPGSTHEIIDERLAGLSTRCRVMLEAASLFRGEFHLRVLRGLEILEEAELLDAIDEARCARLVASAPHPTGGYRFVHGLFREILYDRIPASRRAAMHLRVATVLERRCADLTDTDLFVLAENLLRAGARGRPRDAIDWARRAADHAWRRGGYEQAAEYYVHSLTLGREADVLEDDERFELLIKLADAHQRAGAKERATDAARAAARIARKGGRPDRLARAALVFAGRVRGFAALEYDAEAVQLLDEALAVDGLDETTTAGLESRLAEELTFGDGTERDRCATLVHRALERAERLNDPLTSAYVCRGLRWALCEVGQVEERLAIADRIVDCASHARDVDLAFDGHVLQALAQIELRNLPEARRCLDAATQKAKRPAAHWTLACLTGCFAFLEGRLSDVPATIARGTEQHEAAGVETGQVLLGGQQGHLDWLQGRLDPIEPLIRDLARTTPLVGTITSCGLAATYAEAGRLDDARRELGRIVSNGLRSIPRNPLWTTSMCFLAEACAAVGDEALAEQLYGLLTPFAGRNIVLPPALCLGSADHFLGILAATVRDRDGARAHFERALTDNGSSGARQWTARTHVAYSRLLLSSPACTSDDYLRAMEMLDVAAVACGDLGATRLAEMVETVRRITPAGSFVFAKVGTEWLVKYEEEEANIDDWVGAGYQHRLLETPYVHVECIELVAGHRDTLEQLPRALDDHRIYDDRCLRELRRSARECSAEVHTARADGGAPDAETLRTDGELRQALRRHTFGGTSKSFKDPNEQYRSGVTKALGRLWKHLADEGCPRAAAHLRAATHTGTSCVYIPRPDHSPTWVLYGKAEPPRLGRPPAHDRPQPSPRRR